ncbi:MAG: diguanylate cyclase [Phycisphaerales bacterium]
MPNQPPNPLVLLIDDSVDVHRLLRVRLRHEQIRLIDATNAREGLEMAKKEPPATILLDLDMPDTDGFEVLRALKEDTSTNAIPVIVLSAMSSSEDKVTAFDLGATDYVTKPFDLAELRARLRAALRLDQLLHLLADRANVDGLTGLGNRAHFNKRWAEKVAECRRHPMPLALAMCDVDHFKRVNDTYGHPAGDEVLQGVAKLLQSECREIDVPCRYGGEEFALIMPATSTAEAGIVAERVRESLTRIIWPRHPEHRITVSIGLVGCAGSIGEATAAEWLEQADRNLYTAKHEGRNRIVATELDGRGRWTTHISGQDSPPSQAKAA